MPGNTYIISDLHLSEERPLVFKLFDNFIEFICHNKETKALYILGDFFDYWIGDDNLTEFNQAVIKNLLKLHTHNIKLYFMHGNRDFFIGKKFAKMTHAELLPDPYFIHYAEKQIVLCHGDTLCTNDHSYQIFRFFARIKFLQKIYLALPLFCRQKIALKLRNKSQNKGQRREIQVDVTEKGVNQYKSKKTILIHGHTHKLNIHKSNVFIRAVLGDWHDTGSYILISPDKISLHSWPSQNKLGLIFSKA